MPGEADRDLLRRLIAHPKPGEYLQVLLRETRTSIVSKTQGGFATASRRTAHERLVCVRSLHGATVGDAWTNAIDFDQLLDTVRAARQLRVPVPADARPRPLGTFEPRQAQAPHATQTQLCDTVARTAARTGPGSAEVTVAEVLTTTVIADSEGAAGHQEQAEAQLHVRSLADAATGIQAAALTDDAARLPIVDVATEFLACRDALTAPPYHGPVPEWFVLRPLITARLLSLLSRALFAGPGREPPLPLGTRIGPPSLHIVDDGTLPGGPGTATFDDDGTPTRRTEVVVGGVVVAHLGVASSGPSGNVRRSVWEATPGLAPTNMFIAPTALSAPARTGTGLVVEHLAGLRGGLNLTSAAIQFVVSGAVVRDGSTLGTGSYAVSLPANALLEGLTSVAAPIAFYRVQGVFGGSEALFHGIELQPA